MSSILIMRRKNRDDKHKSNEFYDEHTNASKISKISKLIVEVGKVREILNAKAIASDILEKLLCSLNKK